MAETSKQIGALEFEVLLKNNSIQKQAEQTESIIKSIAQQAEKASESIDNVGKSAEDSIKDAGDQAKKLQEDLKKVSDSKVEIKPNFDTSGIKKIEAELDNVSSIKDSALKDLSAVFEENAKEVKDLNQQLEKEKALLDEVSMVGTDTKKIKEQQQIVVNLEAEISARKKLNDEIEKEKKSVENQTISQQIKIITEAMQELALEGKENTDEYNELLNELGKLKDIKGDIQAQGAILSNDDANLKATTEGLGGLNSALGVVSTSISAVGGSSELLANAMGAVTSATNIFNGVTQVSVALNKDSYFMRMANIKMMSIENTLVKTLGVTSKTAGILVKGAIAGATAGLVLLIPFLIEGVKWLKDTIKSATLVSSLNSEMGDAIASNAGSNIVLLEKMSREYKALEGDSKKQKEYIRDNASAFDTLGVSIKDAETGIINYADANKVLIEQKDAYVQMLMDKAKAEAAYQLQVTKTEEYLKRRLELENNSTSWEGIKEAFKQGGLQGASDYLDATLLRDLNEWAGTLTDQMKEAGEVGTAAALTNLDASFTEEFEALNKMMEEAQKKIEEFWKKSGLTSNDKNNSVENAKNQFNAIFNAAKKGYEDYVKGMNSSNADVRTEAAKNAKELLKSGVTWEEYLNNMLAKYKGNADAMKVIINEIASLEKRGLMELFKQDFEDAINNTRTLTERLEVLRNTSESISDTDPLKSQKNDYLKEQMLSLSQASKQELADANKEYLEYLDERYTETEKYAMLISEIELAYSKATSEEEKKILKDQLDATTTRYSLAQAKEQIEAAKSLTDELVKIETDRQKKLLAIRSDESKTDREKRTEIDTLNEYADADIQLLKEKYKLAGIDFSETLQNSIAGAMNMSLEAYLTEIPRLREQLKSLNPNSEQYAKLQATLSAMEQGYENLKATQSKTTKDMARDKNLKKISDAFNDLGGAISDLGSHFTGTAAEVMNVTGAVFSATSSIINGMKTLTEISTKSIEGVSKATATSIKAVESASVILAIISAAMEITMQIIEIFNKNKDTFEEKKTAYDAYVSTLDIVIEREKELTKTLEAQQAIAEYNAVGKMIEEQADSTRRIASEYLNSRKKGEHTAGKKMSDKMNSADWSELQRAIGGKANSLMRDGRLNGIFDLSVEELKALQSRATGFYSKLDDETRGYIEKIIGYDERLADTTKEKMEQINGISFESFADNFLSALEDMDASAEDIANDISEQMRKALIQDMFKKEYASKLQNYYNKWYEANADGLITKSEKDSLDSLKNSIVNGAVESANKINEMFRETTEDVQDNKTLSGAIKGASQESIDLLAGQTNAVRLNQVEQLKLLRQQYSGLSQINTSIVRNGVILNQILEAVKDSQSNLRAKGLTD